MQDTQDIISKLMRHISHQQTWDHPFMWDYQMYKPCNQVNPVNSIYQTYLTKHVRDTYYQDSHTVHLSKLKIYGMMESQLCSKYIKSQKHATKK